MIPHPGRLLPDERTLFVWEESHTISRRKPWTVSWFHPGQFAAGQLLCFDYAALSREALSEDGSRKMMERLKTDHPGEPTRFGIPEGGLKHSCQQGLCHHRASHAGRDGGQILTPAGWVIGRKAAGSASPRACKRGRPSAITTHPSNQAHSTSLLTVTVIITFNEGEYQMADFNSPIGTPKCSVGFARSKSSGSRLWTRTARRNPGRSGFTGWSDRLDL